MTGHVKGFTIEACSEKDFPLVVKFIEQMQLDSNDLRCNQFLTVKRENQLIGFGRLRNYAGCDELCSLGIIEPFRNKGAGTFLASELMKKCTKPLFVVTIIPEFFKRIGFQEVTEIPPEISLKIKYCTGSLPVAETYIAMRFKLNN